MDLLTLKWNVVFIISSREKEASIENRSTQGLEVSNLGHENLNQDGPLVSNYERKK